MPAQFYPVVSDPPQAQKVGRAMIALHRIGSGFEPPPEGWMLDSGGYQQITRRGEYELSPKEYVREINRLSKEVGRLECAFQQDLVLTEEVSDIILGENLPDYKYRALRAGSTTNYNALQEQARRIGGCEVPIAPVVHGRTVAEYVSHAHVLMSLYDHPVEENLIVGIGSLKGNKDDVGKTPRQPTPEWLRELVFSLRGAMPTARFHAFGIGKKFVLDSTYGPALQRELYSFDTAAWSMAARYGADWSTGDNHDVENARRYAEQIENQMGPDTTTLFQ